MLSEVLEPSFSPGRDHPVDTQCTEEKFGRSSSSHVLTSRACALQVTNSNCKDGANDQVLATVQVTGTASDTLEQGTLAQWVPPAERNADVAGATAGSWPGWQTATEIELTLGMFQSA